MFVHVVIATWNRLPALRQALPAVLDITEYPDFLVTVINDASTDETREWLTDFQASRNQESKRSFSLVHNKKQLGTNKSSNMGWRMHAGHYVKLDNNAVVLRPDWLTVLVDIAEKTRAGIVAYNLEFGHAAANYTQTKINGVTVVDRSAYNVAGKCALIPGWTRDAIGLWNVNIGTPYRGADRLFAFRLRLAGLKSLYHPSWREFVTRVDGDAAGETQQTRKFRARNKLRSYPGVGRLKRAYRSGRLPVNDWSTVL